MMLMVRMLLPIKYSPEANTACQKPCEYTSLGTFGGTYTCIAIAMTMS